MKVLATIGKISDSKKVIIKGIRRVENGRIYTDCILGSGNEDYYSIMVNDEYAKNHTSISAIIPRKYVVYSVQISEPNDCTIIEINGMTTKCIYLGNGKFMKFETSKLWDNTITGQNCLDHISVGGVDCTIFSIGETAKNVTYFKSMNRDEFMDKYNKIDLINLPVI